MVEFNVFVTFAHPGVAVKLKEVSFAQTPVLFVEKTYFPLGCNAKLSVILIENFVICPAILLLVETW